MHPHHDDRLAGVIHEDHLVQRVQRNERHGKVSVQNIARPEDVVLVDLLAEMVVLVQDREEQAMSFLRLQRSVRVDQTRDVSVHLLKSDLEVIAQNVVAGRDDVGGARVEENPESQDEDPDGADHLLLVHVFEVVVVQEKEDEQAEERAHEREEQRGVEHVATSLQQLVQHLAAQSEFDGRLHAADHLERLQPRKIAVLVAVRDECPVVDQERVERPDDRDHRDMLPGVVLALVAQIVGGRVVVVECEQYATDEDEQQETAHQPGEQSEKV